MKRKLGSSRSIATFYDAAFSQFGSCLSGGYLHVREFYCKKDTSRVAIVFLPEKSYSNVGVLKPSLLVIYFKIFLDVPASNMQY